MRNCHTVSSSPATDSFFLFYFSFSFSWFVLIYSAVNILRGTCMNVYKSQLIFFLTCTASSLLLQFSYSSLYERSGFRKQIYIDINIILFFSNCLSTPSTHQPNLIEVMWLLPPNQTWHKWIVKWPLRFSSDHIVGRCSWLLPSEEKVKFLGILSTNLCHYVPFPQHL